MIGSEMDNVKIRISAMEIKVVELEALVSKLIGMAQPKSCPKICKAEKDHRKSELLDGIPYDKGALEEMKTNDLKMLGAALSIKTFGAKRVDTIKAILSAQKKKSN